MKHLLFNWPSHLLRSLLFFIVKEKQEILKDCVDYVRSFFVALTIVSDISHLESSSFHDTTITQSTPVELECSARIPYVHNGSHVLILVLDVISMGLLSQLDLDQIKWLYNLSRMRLRYELYEDPMCWWRHKENRIKK